MEKLESLSVVVALYKSTEYIADFYRRISAVADRVAIESTFIFVDDGCPDGSASVVQRVCKSDSRVSVLKLSRNFGQHQALMAGLSVAEGDWIYVCDGDLEEPPELLEMMVRELRNHPVDLLSGVQQVRRGTGVSKWLGSAFYKVFNRLSEVSIPENLTAVCLMSARFRLALRSFNESHLFLAGVSELVGFRRRTVRVGKCYSGDSSYSFSKRLSMAIDALTSFSAAPLFGLLYVGMAMTALCGVAVIAMLLIGWFSNVQVGWGLLLGIVSFFGSLILLSIGVVGVYVAKVFGEVKQRPNWIIDYAWRGGDACRS